MVLEVPQLLQEKHSTNCQAVCIQMILHYYQDMVTIDEIMNGLKPYLIHETGMHSQGPAIWLAERGYDVTYIAHDLGVIDKDTEHLTEKNGSKILEAKLLEIPNQPNHYRREKIELDIQVLKSGVKYSNEIPSLDLLDDTLNYSIPVKLGVKASGLFANPKNNSNHSIVVVGKVRDEYIINDPNPFHGPRYSINKNQLLMAWYLNGARTLVVKPKK